ncbi:MAG: patatin-like phospholipase family protein [Bacteroidota bacterium]
MSDQHLRYTEKIEDVIASEHVYIQQRRRHYGMAEGDDETRPKDLWGITISGGGIRSATLALGMMQKLIVERLFKRFDYMSTVSGGGYMGACLSSLMHNPTESFVVPDAFAGKQEEMIPGLDADTSPFVRLIKTKPIEADVEAEEEEVNTQVQARFVPAQLEMNIPNVSDKRKEPSEIVLDYDSPEKTRIDVRHQIHHLRTHGEYLTPDKKLFSPSVQKAIGTIFSGIVHNIFLFVLALIVFVSLHYILFDQISNHNFFELMMNPTETTVETSEDVSATEALGQFWAHAVMDHVTRIGEVFSKRMEYAGLFALMGLVLSIGFIIYSRRSRKQYQADELNPEKLREVETGRTYEEEVEYDFIRSFNLWSIFGGPILTAIFWVLARSWGWLDPASSVSPPSGETFDYWIIFSLPACFAMGIFLGTYFILAFVSQQPKQIRISRSFHGALRGGAFYALIISILMPLGILLLFSISFYFDELIYGLFSSISSLVSIVVGYLALNRSGDKDKSNSSGGFVDTLVKRLQGPVLSLSVILFVVLAASAITRSLIWKPWGDAVYFPMVLMSVAFVVFVLSGYFVNSNKLSLHYFYRDRLSEAYLKTDARVKRAGRHHQGMPLVPLRDNENLRLKNLGWRRLKGKEEKEAAELARQGKLPESYRFVRKDKIYKPNPRTPYHLIVTALNLQGTEELVRKDLKSEHFIFSRNYVGSQSTGYVRSDFYRKGRTKLARAMAISAAAVSSGMGFSSFFAQSFITTLLNLRLGYWVENPWYYRANCRQRLVKSSRKGLYLRLFRGWTKVVLPKERLEGHALALQKNPWRKYTFWPIYLVQELLGLTTASQRLVNVSDGGHTGDNLGLMPLLRRRCKFIVVCDFEEDKKYGFASFNHAIRMANVEENIDITIDLKPLIPESREDNNIPKSSASVAIGSIGYPNNTKGTLVYLKSSLNNCDLPVNIYNYRKLNEDFPHQSTADQYFDDAQFEAYRSLGFHIAGEAAQKIYEHLQQAEKET